MCKIKESVLLGNFINVFKSITYSTGNELEISCIKTEIIDNIKSGRTNA